MKTSRRLALAAAFLAPLAAFAHPGHDGDHGLTWDFGHYVAHPFATLACLAVVGAILWLASRLLKSPKAAEPVKPERR